jgi:hypothetical protein
MGVQGNPGMLREGGSTKEITNYKLLNYKSLSCIRISLVALKPSDS